MLPPQPKSISARRSPQESWLRLYISLPSTASAVGVEVPFKLSPQSTLNPPDLESPQQTESPHRTDSSLALTASRENTKVPKTTESPQRTESPHVTLKLRMIPVSCA